MQTPRTHMIPASAIRQAPVDVQRAVFKLPVRTINSIGAAARQGGPDFWYASMRGRPVWLLRSTEASHHQDTSRTIPFARHESTEKTK